VNVAAPLVLVDSVTTLGPGHAGRVAVTGSHGSAIAAHYVVGCDVDVAHLRAVARERRRACARIERRDQRARSRGELQLA
jgi:hypothetical protein